MTQKNKKYSDIVHRRSLQRLIVIGLAIYIVAIGFTGLRMSLTAITTVAIQPVGMAMLCIVLSFFFAAITYRLLVVKNISLVRILLIQIASGLVNRLLPAGLGSLGINAYFLKISGHTLTTALTIVATNNTLGFIGNILLLLVVLSIYPINASLIQVPEIPWQYILLIVIAVLAITFYIKRHHRIAHRLGRSIGEVQTYLSFALTRPLRSSAALLSSVMLTALHAMALFIVLSALDIHLNWSISLIAISIGAFLGAAVPTPGGLGGAEAGIMTTLVAFGVLLPQAVAAALIYRGITYWLPLLPGYFALRLAEKRFLY